VSFGVTRVARDAQALRRRIADVRGLREALACEAVAARYAGFTAAGVTQRRGHDAHAEAAALADEAAWASLVRAALRAESHGLSATRPKVPRQAHLVRGAVAIGAAARASRRRARLSRFAPLTDARELGFALAGTLARLVERRVRALAVVARAFRAVARQGAGFAELRGNAACSLLITGGSTAAKGR